MRTALFLLSGLSLLAGTGLLAHLFGKDFPSATMVLGGIFVVLWLAATAFNMWAGVRVAGFTWLEELPIFLTLFLMPIAIAWLSGLWP